MVPHEPEHDEESVIESVTEGNLIDTTEDLEIENHNLSHNNLPNMDMHLEVIQEREYFKSQCEKLR